MNLRNQSSLGNVILKMDAFKRGQAFLTRLKDFIDRDPELLDYIDLSYLRVSDDFLIKSLGIKWKTGDITSLELFRYNSLNNSTALEFILRVNRNYDIHNGLKDDTTNANEGVSIMEKSPLSFSITIMNGNFMVKPSSSQSNYPNDYSIIIEGIMEEIVK